MIKLDCIDEVLDADGSIRYRLRVVLVGLLNSELNLTDVFDPE